MIPPSYPDDFNRWWRNTGQFTGPASRVSDETVLGNLKEQAYYAWCQSDDYQEGYNDGYDEAKQEFAS